MKILGNSETRERFKKDFLENRLSHAFIIEGARGSGRLTLARALASIVICNGKNPPCGECDACRRVESGAHPDVHEILHTGRTSQIKIDEVREIISQCHIKPSEALWSVFIVENAQMMNTAAQNALLQIFEEPPQNTLFFLLSTDRNRLLKTLVSRARVIKTEKLSDSQLEKYFLDRYPDKKELIARAVSLSDGAAGVGLEILESGESPEIIKTVTDFLKKAADGAGFYTLCRILPPFDKGMTREKLSAVAGYLCLALRDAAVIQSSPSARLAFFSSSAEAEALGDVLGLERIISSFDTLGQIMNKSGTVNIPVAVSTLVSGFASDIK